VDAPLSHRPHGAQLLGAACGGIHLLYVSALSGKANQVVRGGVPVLFPQFADRGPIKKHGFARDLPWQLVEQGAHAGGHRVVCELHIHPGDQPNWPHSAQLVLTAQLKANALHMHQQVRNTGNTTFAWTGGLHPYWATADLCASQLRACRAQRCKTATPPDLRKVGCSTFEKFLKVINCCKMH
jgi:glucose-6-phosphate 1-epimerase